MNKRPNRIKINSSELENIKNLYYTLKKSYSEIGQIYNCSSATICHFFRDNNLTARTPLEANKNIWTKERRDKKSEYMKGKQTALNKRWKMSYKVVKDKLAGKNHPNWQGGKTSLILKLRNSYEYNIWRNSVYNRDNYTCKHCGDNSGGNLNAHHIIPFSDIIKEFKITTFEEGLSCKLLWEVNNGLTLCEDCHKKTDSYLTKKNK